MRASVEAQAVSFWHSNGHFPKMKKRVRKRLHRQPVQLVYAEHRSAQEKIRTLENHKGCAPKFVLPLNVSTTRRTRFRFLRAPVGRQLSSAEPATKRKRRHGQSTARNGCATRESRRLCNTKFGNGPGLLGLFGSFLVGLLGFLCHANLLPSFSRLLTGHAKRVNRDRARCHSYTGDCRKCQENFAVRQKIRSGIQDEFCCPTWAVR